MLSFTEIFPLAAIWDLGLGKRLRLKGHSGVGWLSFDEVCFVFRLLAVCLKGCSEVGWLSFAEVCWHSFSEVCSLFSLLAVCLKGCSEVGWLC